MDFSNWISCQLINPALIFFPQKDEHSVSLRQLNKFINCLQTKLAYQRSLSKINRTIKKKKNYLAAVIADVKISKSVEASGVSSAFSLILNFNH